MTKICEQCGERPAAKSRKLCNSCRGNNYRYRNPTPCECGCGELVADRFKAGHQTRMLPKEEQRRRGRMNDGSTQRDPDGATGYRKVRGRHEHRIVAEQMLGRPLTFDDIVHHVNGNKRDNRSENLQVMTRTEHIKLHRQELLKGVKC